MEDWRAVKRAVFARHSNPWSAWTRWASTPLVLVPVWRRSSRDAALVGAWMAVNPVLFRAPADERAWATRAAAVEMGLLLVYWELMARYWERSNARG